MDGHLGRAWNEVGLCLSGLLWGWVIQAEAAGAWQSEAQQTWRVGSGGGGGLGGAGEQQGGCHLTRVRGAGGRRGELRGRGGRLR